RSCVNGAANGYLDRPDTVGADVSRVWPPRPHRSEVASFRQKRFVKSSKSLGVSGVSWSINRLHHSSQRGSSSEKEHTTKTGQQQATHPTTSRQNRSTRLLQTHPPRAKFWRRVLLPATWSGSCSVVAITPAPSSGVACCCR